MTVSLSRRAARLLRVLVSAFTLLALPVANSAALADGEKLRGVVEMFTSQGCSSCPPADKVLAKYAAENDILALSWHVDYWNYLGWKDTFSSREFTERQYAYARAFKRRGVYTPQAVINGRTHLVGSHHGEIEATLTSFAKAGKGLDVAIEVANSGDAIRIDTADSAKTDGASLWLVYFNRDEDVVIRRGENRGKTITYHNIVREVALLGMTKGEGVSVTLPMAELKKKGFDACAVILQKNLPSGAPGPILGARILDSALDS